MAMTTSSSIKVKPSFIKHLFLIKLAQAPERKEIPHPTEPRLSHHDGGALRHPPDVLVVRLGWKWMRTCKKVTVIFDSKMRAGIQPLVNFGVPVGKTETAGEIVIIRR